MPGSEVTVRVHRPPAIVFDAIASHCWTNDPAWEPEVLGVKRIIGQECSCSISPQTAEQITVRFVVPLR